jgi:hypothetical protein
MPAGSHYQENDMTEEIEIAVVRISDLAALSAALLLASATGMVAAWQHLRRALRGKTLPTGSNLSAAHCLQQLGRRCE